MKRKKTEESSEPTPLEFWPIPGVDEPYPPFVQEALDLVEKETRRRKIRECDHARRYPKTGYAGWDREEYHFCGCHSCGAKEPGQVPCLRDRSCIPEVREARRRMGLQTPSYGFAYERREDIHVSRQIRRVTETARPYQEGPLRKSIKVNADDLDWERISQRNLARREVRQKYLQVLSDPEGEPLFNNDGRRQLWLTAEVCGPMTASLRSSKLTKGMWRLSRNWRRRSAHF